jgi:hypothetical protein
MGRVAINLASRPPRTKPGFQPNLTRKGRVSRRALLAHTDPGPPEEAEEFVRLIYELRRKSKPRIVLE